MSDIAAFFDIDNTLLKVNSARLYMRYFYSHGVITFPQLARIAGYILLHRLNILKEEKAMPRILSIVADTDHKKAMKIVNKAFKELVKDKISPSILKILNDHKQKGHHVVLITASPVITSNPIFAYVDADHLLASIFKIENDKFTGECLHLMYGEGKIGPMKEYAEEHKINLKKSYCYADSFSDRVIMELVGNPIAVNPDKKLKSYAKDNGWKIIGH